MKWRRTITAKTSNPARTLQSPKGGIDDGARPSSAAPPPPLEFPSSHADVLVAEGNAFMARGRPTVALASYQRALAVRPDCVPALNNRGVALRILGSSAEALASFDAALEIQPEHLDALNNRGRALVDLGRADEALRSFDKALAINPHGARALNNRGNALMKLRRAEEALASYQQALALEPRAADAHNNRGTALRELRRYDEALASFDRALALLPGNAEILCNAAHTLLDLGRAEDALANYDLAIALRPDYDQAHNGRGNALAKLGRENEALASYDRAISLAPGAAPAHNNKGLALMQSGRVEEGGRLIEIAVGLDEKSGLALHNLSLAKKFEPGDAIISEMEAFARNASPLDVDGRIYVHFALGKAYADIGRFEASFHHFSHGNGLKRAQSDYDEPSVLGALARTRSTYSREAMARRGGHGDPSPLPVFVFGMPRSGTTLVEQILASHREVHGAGEINDFEMAVAELGGAAGGALTRPELALDMTGAQLDRIGANYIRRIRAAASAASRIVDKMTENFRFAGLIGLALPHARMIHVRRDPLDTCLSCFSTLFAEDLLYAYDLSELGHYHRAYEGLMDHWRAALPPGMMLEVRYEDVIADLEGQSRRIVDHCGLEWDAHCLEFHRSERSVRTASFAQVRRPLYPTSVGRWRNYEAFLGPLIAALDRADPAPRQAAAAM
jgi:tetratricopeptide (TPR) repeat protein